MNQIKDDAEQFRKLRSEMAKEVLQLKSQVCFRNCCHTSTHGSLCELRREQTANVVLLAFLIHWHYLRLLASLDSFVPYNCSWLFCLRHINFNVIRQLHMSSNLKHLCLIASRSCQENHWQNICQKKYNIYYMEECTILPRLLGNQNRIITIEFLLTPAV